jgi:hypothetical protein
VTERLCPTGPIEDIASLPCGDGVRQRVARGSELGGDIDPVGRLGRLERKEVLGKQHPLGSREGPNRLQGGCRSGPAAPLHHLSEERPPPAGLVMAADPVALRSAVLLQAEDLLPAGQERLAR